MECGAEFVSESKFCGKCGTAVGFVNSTTESPHVKPKVINHTPVNTIRKFDINNLSTKDAFKVTAIFLILCFIGVMVFESISKAQKTNESSSIVNTFLRIFTADDRADQAVRLIKMQFSDPSQLLLVSSKVVWDGKDIKGNPSYVVRIEYDGRDIMGTMRRTCYLVPYIKVKNGFIYDTYDPFHRCGDNDPTEKINISKLVQHYFVSGEINYRE